MMRVGKEEGGVAMRLMLTVDLEESCVKFSPRLRSESKFGCREDIERVSAGLRDAFVQIEELLDFFESRGSLKKLELLDVADQILEVSLGSLETARRPVALRNRLTTPDEDDIRESIEPGREALIWKFDRGREGSAASFINTDKTLKLKKTKTYVVLMLACHF